MTRHEQLQEQYEEALFALLMDGMASTKGKKALLKNEELKNNPQAAVPKDVERRCLRTIRRNFSVLTVRSVGHVAKNLISRVSVGVLLMVLLVSVAFAASPAFRISTLNFLIQTFDEYTSFGPVSANNTSLPTIAATWLPTGYQLEEQYWNSVKTTSTYCTPDGNEIFISVTDVIDGEYNVDTENAEIGTEIINGYEAVTISKTAYDGYDIAYNENRIVWIDTCHGWCIDITSYQESMEILVQFAENINLA